MIINTLLIASRAYFQHQVPVAIFCPVFDLQKIHIKRSPNEAKLFVDFFWARRPPRDRRSTREAARGGQHPPGRARGPRRALMGGALLGVPSTTSLLYKYSNIPETLGEP